MDKIQIKVLLVEDNLVDVIFLREALQQDTVNSFELTTVERLQSAAETLSENSFDIILLDLGLPDTQGLETFTYIDRFVPGTPKIILSGLTNETLALQAVHDGAQDYIVKGRMGFASAARAIRYAIERQEAKNALRASEERFRAMIQNGLDDFSLLDANGTLLWESPSAVRNLGYPVDSFVGQNIFKIVHPDDQGWTRDLYVKACQTPNSRETGVFRLQHADGSWRWIEAIITNMLDTPSVQAIVVNYRDISDRKQAEETIRSLAKFPEENPNPVLRIGKDGQIIYANPASHKWLTAWGVSLNDLLPKEWQVLAVDAYQHNTKQTLDMSIQGHIYAISIVPFPQDGYTNVYGQDVTESRQAEEKVHTAHEFLQASQNALSAHISILDDDGTIVQVNSAWREFADQNGLVSPDYGIGLNYLDICDSATGVDAEEAPLVANAIREILAGKIEQAQIEYPCHSPTEQRWFLLQITSFKDEDKRFVVLAQENITERKLAEQAVRDSSEQFHTLFEASPEAIMIVDPHGDWQILDCNAAGCAMNGYTRAELIGQSVDVINTTPGNQAERSEYLERVRKAGILRFETSHRRKDGTLFPVEVSTSLITFSGREVVLGIDRDITERKQAEQKLLESEREFRTLAEAMPQIVWITRPDGWNIYFNQQWVDYTGQTLEESYGNGWNKPFHPDDQQRAWDAWQYATKNGAAYLLDCRLRRADGIYRWWLIRGVPVLDASGTVLKWFGTCTDIHERKQAEDALRESEKRYRTLFEDLPIAIWEEDFSDVKKHLDSLTEQGITDFRAYFASNPGVMLECANKVKVLDVNNTAIKMFSGKSKEQLISNANQELSKGEREHLAQFLANIADGKTSNHWEGGDETFTGNPIEISLSWSVVPGYENDYSQVIVTTLDITERKQAEEKLRESEARFASIFNTNPTRVSITSLEDGRFLDVNEAFLASTGYSREEVLGHTSLEFNDWVVPQERVRLHSLLEAQGSVQNFETQLRRKSGEILDILISAELVELFGQRCILSVGLDITERKQAEKELSENAADLALINHLNETINRRESLIVLMRMLDREFKRQFNTTGAALYLLSEDGKTLNMPSISLPQELAKKIEKLIGRSIPSIQIPVRPGGLFHELLNTPQGTIITDPREIQQWIAEFAETESLPAGFKPIIRKLVPQIHKLLNIKSVISLPLTLEGRTIGVLDVYSSHLLNVHDLERFQRISGQLSAGILRHQDEQKLRESNERFHQLADHIEEVFWITDAITEEEIYLSPAAEKVWGHSIEELMQTPRTFIEQILPEDHNLVLRALDQQKNGQRTEIEYRVLQPDESVHWIWDRAFPIFDDSGRVVRLAGIAADITERKQSESAVQRHLSELEALYENGLAIGRLLDTNEIAQRIIATFEKYLSWHHVAIRLKAPESDELKLVALNQAGLSETEKSAMELHLNFSVGKVGQGLSGWVVQTGEPLRTGNVHAHAQYVNTYPNIQSGLFMPLKVGDYVMGVISVESEMPDAFSEQDERLLATLANQAAIAFENARLYQSARQELLERERIEIKLRVSETHYRELTDSITDVFFEMDQNLCYTHWNKASEKLTGIPEALALGKSIHEVFGTSQEQTQIENIYESVLLSQQPTTFETDFITDHQLRAFEINAYPSTRGVAVVAKDVTVRKKSEIVLQKRFKLMEYAARHTLAEIMQRTVDEVVDLTGSHIGFFHILAADQTTLGLQIWGTKTFSLFNSPASEGQYQKVEQAGVWVEAVEQRRAIIHNDYESLPSKKGLSAGHAPLIREVVIPIIRNEKVLAVLGIGNKPEDYTQQDLEIAERFADYAWDITERKQMELALAEEHNQLSIRVEERTADLSRANANLARALRVKDEFLANMSHELRTPLNAILGLSESLAEQTAGPLNEKQQRYLTTVTESGHHLLSLINDILDLAKIEAGQIELDVNKVSIQSVCDASMRMIKQLARKKNQETVVEIEDKLGLIWADERRLKQMLVNLLSNAVKFTPEGGKFGLEVRGDQDENKITFTVWDSGIGIKDVDLPRLFQPFVQLDAGLSRESSGTGLGLALVAQMARMHGGSVSAVSEPARGSRFTIMLPWKPAFSVETAEKLKVAGKYQPIKFNKNRQPVVLLVEDTEDVIMMISDYLVLNGLKVITARDGMEGVAQARLTHPDLILMDIQMPRMNGLEAAKKLRSEPEFKQTPIIALTALAMPKDRESCLAAGMNEYITKPVHLRGLVQLIELLLSGETEGKSP